MASIVSWLGQRIHGSSNKSQCSHGKPCRLQSRGPRRGGNLRTTWQWLTCMRRIVEGALLDRARRTSRNNVSCNTCRSTAASSCYLALHEDCKRCKAGQSGASVANTICKYEQLMQQKLVRMRYTTACHRHNRLHCIPSIALDPDLQWNNNRTGKDYSLRDTLCKN